MFPSAGLGAGDHFFCTVIWDMYRICAWMGGKDGSGLRDVWWGEPRGFVVNEASVVAAEGVLARIGRLDLTRAMLFFFDFWMGLSTWRQDERAIFWGDSLSCADDKTLATARGAVCRFGSFFSPVMLFLLRGPLGKRRESDNGSQLEMSRRILTIISE